MEPQDNLRDTVVVVDPLHHLPHHFKVYVSVISIGLIIGILASLLVGFFIRRYRRYLRVKKKTVVVINKEGEQIK